MPDNNSIYQQWLDKAEEDEFAGKRILDGKRFPAPACFHFQQMTEKCLKALLLYYGKEFPKTHDLIVLAALLEPSAPEVKEYKTELKLLNRYYVETRYPGDYPEFTAIECRQAFEAASHIKKFVLDKSQD